MQKKLDALFAFFIVSPHS